MKMKIAFLVLLPLCALGQNTPLTLDQAVQLAVQNNQHIRAQELHVLSQKQLKKTDASLPKTDVRLMYGQYNSYAKQDNNITVSQIIPFTAFGSQSRLNREMLASSELNKAVAVNDIVYQTKQIYLQLAYAHARRQLLEQQDSIFSGFFKSANARYKSGETNLLEKTTAEVQMNEAKNQLRQNESDILALRTQLRMLLNSELLPEISATGGEQLDISPQADTFFLETNPSLALSRQQVDLAKAEHKLESAKAAPDLLVGYFNQTLIGTINPESGLTSGRSDRFSGFEIGIAIPLWFAPHQGRIKSAELNYESAKMNSEYQKSMLSGQWKQAVQNFEKNRLSLEYFRTSALPNASLILRQAQTASKAGEIGYTEYLIGIRNALQIREGFFATLHAYNQSVILIEYLTGNTKIK